jgi:endo-1,4-beta-xylanase
MFSDVEAQKQSDTYKYIVEMYESLPQNQNLPLPLGV